MGHYLVDFSPDELRTFGPSALTGTVLSVTLGRAFLGALTLGPAVSGLTAAGLVAAGAAAGIAGWWWRMRRHQYLIGVGDEAVELLRAGTLVARMPLATLEVRRHGERRDDGQHTRYFIGATLAAAGERPIELHAPARLADLEGQRSEPAGGLRLTRPAFEALMGELAARGVPGAGATGR